MARPTEWSVPVTQPANTQVIASKAGVPGKRHYITGFHLSVSAAPAASVMAVLRNTGGANITDQVVIPAALFPPIIVEFESELMNPIGADVDVVLPALGAGVVGVAVLRGYTQG